MRDRPIHSGSAGLPESARHFSAVPMLRRWHDVAGARLHAHGGGIFFAHGRSWWVGETEKVSADSSHGIACYSSVDLERWRNEGIVLHNSDVRGLGGEVASSSGWVMERPKVLFNARTGLFVMWFHLERSRSYSLNAAGVATSSTPCGRYSFRHALRPGGLRSFDATLFQDSHRLAYRVQDVEHKAVVILRLSADFLNASAAPVSVLHERREAPCLFRWAGRYHLLTSGLTWWNPNPAALHVADSLRGPWTHVGNPFLQSPAGGGPEQRGERAAATSFHSQPAFVLVYTSERQEQVALLMADRWCPRGERCSQPWCTCLLQATYLWQQLLPPAAAARSAAPLPPLVVAWKPRWRPPAPHQSTLAGVAAATQTALPPFPPSPPQPPPPPPSPPPAPSVCHTWCTSHPEPWEQRCRWQACAACEPCGDRGSIGGERRSLRQIASRRPGTILRAPQGRS